MDMLIQDVRYAIRQFARNPGFTAIASLALAIGIGANTAIFSAVNAVLLQPLPFRDQGSLVWIWERDLRTDDPRNPVSPLSFAAFRDEGPQIFEGIGSSRDDMYNLTGEGEPETLIGYRFSHDFFQVLGTPPLLGRTFLPEEDRPGAARVVVLSHALWTRRFAADPAVVGRPITLDGESYTVVGVMPKGFQHPARTELWTPLALTPEQAASRDRRFLRLVGRLKPGVTLARAQSAVDRVAERLATLYPESHARWGAVVNPIESRYTGDVKPALLVLLGAVGFVLLIACANVANLLLARGAGRLREVAVRAALGASRRRVVRQLLSESLLLALFGGALGTLFAQWGLGALLGLFPRSVFNVAIPRLEEIELDAGVLVFTLLLSLATGLLFGLLPALQVSRVELGEALQHATRGGGGQPGQRLRSALVVSEVALAVVLVTGGTLMLKSFLRLQSSGLGFEPKGLLTARVLLPEYRYDDSAKRLAFFEQAVAAVRALPGVEAVGVTPFLPLSGWSSGRPFRIEGQTPPAPGQEPEAELRVVNEDYFRAMRIGLVKGRAFSEADRAGTTQVAIINEAMARRHFPGEEPLGRRLWLQVRGSEAPEDPRHIREIVGVVADVRHYGLTRPAEPEVYLAWRQEPVELIGFAVRTAADPMSLVKGVREAVWSVDKDQPVTMAMTYEQLASDSMTLQRASTQLVSFFAGVALLLAALGIYGVMAYAVARRTHEIGVRVALGARGGDVIRLVLGHGMRLAGIGAALGLAASFALTRVLGSLLYGVSATDPASFAGVLVLVAVASLLACYLPARRATRVDPMVALRYE